MSRVNEFELTEQHVKLLTNMYVEWWDAETGAPGIDPKRPYGNSWVSGDVAHILGIVSEETDEDDEDEKRLSDEQENFCHRIHSETQTALQIVLSTKSFEPGLYRLRETYDVTSWERVTS